MSKRRTGREWNKLIESWKESGESQAPITVEIKYHFQHLGTE